MIEKLEDVKFEQEATVEFTEEQLQNIKDWMNNPISQNLKNHLKQKIEQGKTDWMMGSYIPADRKSVGDADSGYCLAFQYILDFIESGGITNVGK